MKLVIEDDAKQDLRDCYHFYEETEPGAGKYFFDNIQSELHSLINIAGIHRKRFGFHFYASKHFPHGIYYLADDDCLRIAGIIDSRRSPQNIRKILRTR
jgi:plasmid stabilization system protein ParE